MEYDLTCDSFPDAGEILAICTRTELKQNLRISHAVEDTFVDRCLRYAYDYLDGRNGWLNRAILTQDWTLRLPGFVQPRTYSDRNSRPAVAWDSSSEIELPLPPLQEVLSVKYRDTAGDLQTIDPDNYTVITSTVLGKIVRADGVSWPTLGRYPQAVEIAFRAGYGDAADVRTKAAGIENAIRLLASDFFRNREDTYAEPRLVAVNRQIINGVIKVAGRYRLHNRYA